MVRAHRVILSHVLKDLLIWYRRPVMIIATVAPSISYVFITFFVSFTIGRMPVALVVEEPGPLAARMASVIQNDEAFIPTKLNATDAAAALESMDVAAVVTIPATFDVTLAAGHPTPLMVVVNNVNADEADDLRRSVPAAITTFYESAPQNPFRIFVAEKDTHASDFTLAQFEFIPIIVFTITISGIISSGLMACEEWETGTIKELLLAPAPRYAIVTAKLLSGWTMTMLLAAVVAGIGASLGFLRLPGAAVAPCIAMLFLVGLASAGVGNALGTALRRVANLQPIGVQTAVNLFFFSGGISVIAFLPDTFQHIARFVPTYYAVHALDRQIFYGTQTGVALDFAVVSAVAAGAIAVSVAVFRRRTW